MSSMLVRITSRSGQPWARLDKIPHYCLLYTYTFERAIFWPKMLRGSSFFIANVIIWIMRKKELETYFFFLVMSKHGEVPGPGIEPTPHQWPEPQQWQCQIFNPSGRQGAQCYFSLLCVTIDFVHDILFRNLRKGMC